MFKSYFGNLRLSRSRFAQVALVGFGLAFLVAALLSWGHVKHLSGFLTTKPDNTVRESAIANGLPATVVDPARYGTGMQRTMKLLTTSTPEHRHTVRILFYGQSITKQNWWLAVADDFRQRFPNANLIFDNRSIGGFDSSKLVQTAEHDINPFYPDLIIFHVYGGHRDYESIIANARRQTTTEIVLISDHVTWSPTNTAADTPDELKTYKWHNEHSMQWLPELAQKYGCELIEIRRPWEQYLKETHLQANALLADEIHLNDRGNVLMAKLVKTHLQNLPKLPIKASDDAVKQYAIGTDIKATNDNKLTLEFDGNRVELVAAAQNSAQPSIARVLIDGKSPSALPDLYTFTRPSNAVGVEWPAILKVSSEKPLLLENWKVVITDIDLEANKFKFEAFGSETGFDGSGESDQKFVSNSGRVVIDPQNWWLKSAYEFSKKSTPVGFQIQWQVEPLFTDVYVAPTVTDPSHEYKTLLAQNLSNAKHTLELLPVSAADLPSGEILVYHPSAS